MAVSDAMRRLLNVRALEEEQEKLALESTLSELHRIENALGSAKTRARSGRQHVAAAAQSGETVDRVAGLVECESARRSARALETRLAETGRRAAGLREQYLSKRIERRQVETVIQEAEAVDALEGVRREQQNLDDWFIARRSAQNADRQNTEKHEMKDSKESGPIPEEELRSRM